MAYSVLKTGAAAALAVGTLALAAPAGASTITFETAPLGPGFTGPVSQDGFTYSTFSGGLYVNGLGDPSRDMEGAEAAGGGVLNIVSASGDFTFSSLDYAAYDSTGTGSQTLQVNGYLGGVLVGTDTYILANTANAFPSYANWTLESADNLAGVKLDDLQIVLNAFIDGSASQQAIDNVTLLAVPAPEPATWALMLAGFAGLGAALRTRRRPQPA